MGLRCESTFLSSGITVFGGLRGSAEFPPKHLSQGMEMSMCTEKKHERYFFLHITFISLFSIIFYQIISSKTKTTCKQLKVVNIMTSWFCAPKLFIVYVTTSYLVLKRFKNEEGRKLWRSGVGQHFIPPWKHVEIRVQYARTAVQTLMTISKKLFDHFCIMSSYY